MLKIVLTLLLSNYIVYATETEMIKITAGTYMMGSNKGRDNEKPVHKVNIDYDFFMDKYEVTIGQYKECVKDNFCEPSLKNQYSKKMCQDDNCPVINVSWDDAKNYAKYLSKKTSKKYRLPTEAEWEYAARAGTTSEYSFGNDKKDLHIYAWYGRNDGATTKKIGTKKPNPWGLYDMHGGVWEWCEDSYLRTYDKKYIPYNGTAFKNGKIKVLRGGSWYCPDNYLRSAYRLTNIYSAKNTKAGFRLVRDE